MPGLLSRGTYLGLSLLLLLHGIPEAAPAQSPAGRFTIPFLKLSSADLQVLSFGHLSLDSTLVVVSRDHGISPAPVITEGMDDAFTANYSRWMNTGHVDSMLALLPGLDEPGRVEATLLIGAWYAFQPGTANYRKAISLLEQTRKDANRLGKAAWEAQCYCLLGKAWFMLGDTANGKKWFSGLAGNPLFKGLDAIQAKALSYAGMYCPFMPETHRYRLDRLGEAEKRYGVLKDTGNLVNALMDIAYMRFASGNVRGSDETAARALALQQTWHFPNTQYCYDLLAFLRKFQGDYSGGLQMALSALKVTESTGDRWFLPRAYARIGDVYQMLNNEDAALEMHGKAVQAEMDLGPDMLLYILLPTLTRFTGEQLPKQKLLTTIQNTIARYPPTDAIQQQRVDLALGSCYASLGDLAKAGHYYQLAWELEPQATKMRGGMNNINTFFSMGYINLITGNYSESRKFLKLILEPPLFEQADQVILWKTYYSLYRVDSATGNFRSAIKYFYLYDSVNHYVSDMKQSTQILKLKDQYETLQQEKKVQQLESENRLQQQKDASTKKIFYGGFMLSGVITLLVFLLYYNKRRKNRKLQAQKTEIDKQNRTLQELNREQSLLIEEKEWLLREIHHRVKNNLQVITSLLLSQSEFLRDQAAIDIMKESQRRVETMSLIHQKLYNSASLSNIYMPEYIGELVDYLKESFSLRHKVIFSLDIEKIWLDVSKAVPLGLILNEVITNAFKYAFPYSAEDRISIRLMAIGEFILLEVKDNGRGLPENFDVTTGSSFGMILMRGMAEDLQGGFEVDGTNGTSISIRFNNQPSTRD